MDTMALALKVAARMIEDGELDKRVMKRYSGWNSELGQQIFERSVIACGYREVR